MNIVIFSHISFWRGPPPYPIPKAFFGVEITFDPPWTKDLMSEEAKLELGFL